MHAVSRRPRSRQTQIMTNSVRDGEVGFSGKFRLEKREPVLLVMFVYVTILVPFQSPFSGGAN